MHVVTLYGYVCTDVFIVPRRTMDFLIFPKGVKTSTMKNIIKGKNAEVLIPALPFLTVCGWVSSQPTCTSFSSSVKRGT